MGNSACCGDWTQCHEIRPHRVTKCTFQQNSLLFWLVHWYVRLILTSLWCWDIVICCSGLRVWQKILLWMRRTSLNEHTHIQLLNVVLSSLKLNCWKSAAPCAAHKKVHVSNICGPACIRPACPSVLAVSCKSEFLSHSFFSMFLYAFR